MTADASLRVGSQPPVPVALTGEPSLDRDATGKIVINLGRTRGGTLVAIEVTSLDWLFELIMAAREGYIHGDVGACELAVTP